MIAMSVVDEIPLLRASKGGPPSGNGSSTPTRPDGLSDAANRVGARDRPCVTILTGDGAGQLVCLRQAALVFGRGADAEVRLEDGSLSRRHARVFQADRSVYIEDLRSTNGTFVRGQRIDSPFRLHDGDLIQLGPNRVLRFEYRDALDVDAAALLHETSVRDTTCGAFNRRHFEARFEAELAFAQRSGRPLAVLMIDIDHFKTINDTYGHVLGDSVLRVLVASIQRLLRRDDLLARYGGDEFIVLCRNTTGRNGRILADRICAVIHRLQFTAAGNDFRVSVTVGVAAVPEIDADRDHLLSAADDAMYRAKPRPLGSAGPQREARE